MKDFLSGSGIIYHGNRKFVPVGDENKILWQERRICSGFLDPEAVWEEDVGSPLPLTELPAEVRSLVPEEWIKNELLRRKEARRAQIRRQAEKVKAEAEKAKAEAEARAREQLIRPAQRALAALDDCLQSFSGIEEKQSLTDKVRFFQESLEELAYFCRQAEKVRITIPDGKEFDSFRREFNKAIQQVKSLLK
jgi:hypothetical protein